MSVNCSLLIHFIVKAVKQEKAGHHLVSEFICFKDVPLMHFYTPPHDSGGVLWFHFGLLCVCPSVRTSAHFSFPDDNFSKHQWIFTKLGLCIDIVEIWFEIAYGQISSYFYRVICPQHDNGRVL